MGEKKSPRTFLCRKGGVLYIDVRPRKVDIDDFEIFTALTKVGDVLKCKVFPITLPTRINVTDAKLTLKEATKLAALYRDNWSVMKEFALDELERVRSIGYCHDAIMQLSIEALYLFGIPTRTINTLKESGCDTVEDIFICGVENSSLSAKAMADVFWQLKDAMYTEEADFFMYVIVKRAQATHKSVPDVIKAYGEVDTRKFEENRKVEGAAYKKDGTIYIDKNYVDPDDVYIEEYATGIGKIAVAVGKDNFPAEEVESKHLDAAGLTVKEYTTIATCFGQSWPVMWKWARKMFRKTIKTNSMHDAVMGCRINSLRVLGIPKEIVLRLMRCNCLKVGSMFDSINGEYKPELVIDNGPTADDMDRICDAISSILTVTEMSSISATVRQIRLRESSSKIGGDNDGC